MDEGKAPKNVRVEKGMGIWGNMECVQCGACCHEYNTYLHESGIKDEPSCGNFEIRDGKAYCLEHCGEREPVCENYFCGNTQLIFRFRFGGDEKLRSIAKSIGTAPSNYTIPTLM